MSGLGKKYPPPSGAPVALPLPNGLAPLWPTNVSANMTAAAARPPANAITATAHRAPVHPNRLISRMIPSPESAIPGAAIHSAGCPRFKLYPDVPYMQDILRERPEEAWKKEKGQGG